MWRLQHLGKIRAPRRAPIADAAGVLARRQLAGPPQERLFQARDDRPGSPPTRPGGCHMPKPIKSRAEIEQMIVDAVRRTKGCEGFKSISIHMIVDESARGQFN